MTVRVRSIALRSKRFADSSEGLGPGVPPIRGVTPAIR